MIKKIVKRDGRIVNFEIDKIYQAIAKASEATQAEFPIGKIVDEVVDNLGGKTGDIYPTVEEVQDEIERVLIEHDYSKTAKAYILYRSERSRIREAKSRLMSTIKDITFLEASKIDVKRRPH